MFSKKSYFLIIFAIKPLLVMCKHGFMEDPLTKNDSVLSMCSSVFNSLFYSTSFRLVSTILSTLQIEGFDVKALRAFRVLRPLRLVSGVPSKFDFRFRLKFPLSEQILF